MKISTAFLLTAALVPSIACAVTAPTNGGASAAGPKTIALQWTDTSADETSFEIQRHNGDNSWTPLATLEPNTTYYYDRSGLTEQTTWHYRVRSVENANNSDWLDLGSATTTITMNILFFFSDDMGYKDIVALRNEEIDGPTIYETPAVDTLVSQGLTITNAYCSGPRCVVARRCVQTGKYDWRPEAVPPNDYYIDHNDDFIGGGIYAGGTTLAASESGAGVTIPDNVTYGEAVKTAGYRTCFIGKYHLGESAPTLHTPTGYSFGDQPGRGPVNQGYDVSIAAGHAGAPPSSYFAVENLNAGAAGAYTFELPDLDDTNYMLTPAAPASGDYITDRMTDKAIGFINDVVTNYPTQPFHLSLAHYAVHTPAEAKTNADSTDGKGYEYFQSKKDTMHASGAFGASHPAGGSALITDYSSKTRVWQDNPVYAAMMKSYDESLAEIRAYLAATTDPRYPSKKLSETTIIVLTSDHGGKSTTPIEDNKLVEAADGSDTVNPPAVYVPGDNAYKSGTPNTYSSYPTSNYPYRQGKTWVYEGGLKVPLIIHFPGVTTPGSTSNAFVHHADLFASFCDMAGATQQPAEATDSKSFALTCGQPESAARNEMHHFFTNANAGTGNPALAAYRRGDYKLIYFMVQRRVELYNLAADPYEQNDLSESRPALAAAMLHEIYQQAVSTGMSMPKPGSNTWTSEQSILVDNGVISSLPAVPDASPSGLSLSETAEGKVQLSWTVNASNATHSVIYRSGPIERFNKTGDTGGIESYREVAYVPVGTTTWVDESPIYDPTGDGTNKLNLYKYRVESENLGGWAGGNTGNQTITVTDPSAAAATASDDTVTTVPGETLRVSPLLNDIGVGTLSISAITQPTLGSATIDGSHIEYTAPEDFAGSVTMTYTILATNGQADTATITINLPVQPESLTTLQNWEFNEASGTNLENTTSTSGLQFAGTTANDVDTDGSGNILLVQGGDYNLDTGSIGPFTSGKYRLTYVVTAADFTNSDNGTAAGFAFRDTTSGKNFGTVRIRRNAGKLRFELRKEDGTGNNAYYTSTDATIANLVVTSTLDLDTGTVTTEATLGGSPLSLTNATLPFDPAASQFNALRFSSKQSTLAGGDTVSIGSLKLEKVEAAVTLYDSWATAFPWNGVLDKGENGDPDLDGVSNLLEFAFGLDPLANDPRPLPSITLGSPSTVGFTPYRDTTLLNYTVEFSDDLSIWDSYTSFSLSTPAGQAVNVDMPSSDRIFSRINISTP